MVTDPIVWPVLDAMLECLITTFEADEEPPGIIRHHFGNGNAIAQISPDGEDNECCDGLVWVRLARAFPTGNDALTQTASASSCFDMMAVPIEIGAVRCWPRAGEFATPEDWALTTERAVKDYKQLRNAVQCCFIPGNEYRWQTVIGAYDPIGVTGQCVGGRLALTVGPNAADCCDPGPTSP